MEELMKDIGSRLRDMREILEIPVSEMAQVTGATEADYLAYHISLSGRSANGH